MRTARARTTSDLTTLFKHAASQLILACVAILVASNSADAAISWDGGGSSSWWFDPVNWSRDQDAGGPFLPPSQGDPVSSTDTQINGVGAAPQTVGANVVFDPSSDPFFAAAAARPFAEGFGPQIINPLYISRNTTNHNTLTINGDLESMANVIVGRSGSTAEAQNLGRIIQTGGTFKIGSNVLDLGQREASGWGNGTYDYRGGVLEVSLNNGAGIRLAGGGSTGTGGVGRFIMHNPATPGYVRAFNFNVAAHAGVAGSPETSPDGVTTGVGIVEFHYQNGGTRPIQVSNQLLINNGTVTTGTRSSRLELVLEAPVTLAAGLPQNLGLFDVDFAHDPINSGAFVGAIVGAGDLGRFFSNGDGSLLYNEGAMVSATFGSTKYNWTISYSGDITWTSPTSNVVSTITGIGTGVDVVLIGHSTETLAVEDADFNNDNIVNGNDFLIWQRGRGVGVNNASGDADGNGVVDAADLAIWKSQFGNPPPAVGAVAAIPEPAAATLALLAGVALLVRRRR